MYKLYWAAETGALAPQIILEEVGADYERVVIDMEKGEEMQAGYLAINPRGQIPALTLPDGSVVTESAAIVLHLADTYPDVGLLPPAGSAERAQVYRWLFYAVANIYESVERLYYSDRYTTDARSAESVEQAAREYMDNAWDLLETELNDGPFLLGNQYTVIDAYLLMLTRWHEQPQTLLSRCPKLKLLCDSVRSRPAVERIWSQHYPQDS
ncbi:MAG: glutathione S-transferase N-terminal domain-containing protein [Proteobacteria bacterium]|nr:glutathione S-transferase N-terminal domain-containing protein [Pseudomonadota bacterium]MCH8177812.1 glutathione S-transferase N-terminal domain-containing protein [Pseudomonadota bacterium]